VDGSQNDELPVHRASTDVTPGPILRRASTACNLPGPSTPTGGRLPGLAGTTLTTPRQEITQPVPIIPVASNSAIDSWQSTIFSHNGRLLPLKVAGPTARAVAETLLARLVSLRDGTPFSARSDVRCQVDSLASFIHRYHDIEMCVDRVVLCIPDN
jgi:hypothetical protein